MGFTSCLIDEYAQYIDLITSNRSDLDDVVLIEAVGEFKETMNIYKSMLCAVENDNKDSAYEYLKQIAVETKKYAARCAK
jgi:hypothetical protein